MVLDAQTGDVVALASAPTFDISKFTTGIPTEDYQRSSPIPRATSRSSTARCRVSTRRAPRSSRSAAYAALEGQPPRRPTGRRSTRRSRSTTRASSSSARPATEEQFAERAAAGQRHRRPRPRAHRVERRVLLQHRPPVLAELRPSATSRTPT